MKYLKPFLLWIGIGFVIACLFAMNPKCNETIGTYVTEDGETVEEEQIKTPFLFASLGISFVVTTLVLMVPGYNKIQKTKAQLPSLEANVKALEERREHQLEQANKVLDKYLAHESGIQVAAANAHVDNGSDFKAIVEKYPELSSNNAVSSLMDQIVKVEGELVHMKTLLNARASEYNGAIHSFPMSMFRKMLKLEDYEFQVTSVTSALDEAPISDEDLGI